MFDFHPSYDTKEKTECSKEILLIKNNGKQHTLLKMSGKEPDENSGEWVVRRERQ